MGTHLLRRNVPNNGMYLIYGMFPICDGSSFVALQFAGGGRGVVFGPLSRVKLLTPPFNCVKSPLPSETIDIPI